MSMKWRVGWTIVAVIAAFVGGAWFYKERAGLEDARSAAQNSDALVRPHSPVFGNPAARVTIVEFFDPSCETCRAFYPIVKGIVTSSFGQVRLVVRYAPLHEGSDTAVKILEAARPQGKYWEALEKALATQPMWAAHGDPKPDLIWKVLTEVGVDVPAARAAASGAAIEQVLRQDVADMKILKVSQTPSFFVNGTPLREFGEAQLKSLVAQELAKARNPASAARQGTP